MSQKTKKLSQKSNWKLLIVLFLQKKGIGLNTGKFKVGDRIVFNWSAKVTIPSIVAIHPGIKVVSYVKEHYKTDVIGWVDTIDDTIDNSIQNVDSFWLRKAWPWEKLNREHKIRLAIWFLFGIIWAIVTILLFSKQ